MVKYEDFHFKFEELFSELQSNMLFNYKEHCQFSIIVRMLDNAVEVLISRTIEFVNDYSSGYIGYTINTLEYFDTTFNDKDKKRHRNGLKELLYQLKDYLIIKINDEVKESPQNVKEKTNLLLKEFDKAIQTNLEKYDIDITNHNRINRHGIWRWRRDRDIFDFITLLGTIISVIALFISIKSCG